MRRLTESSQGTVATKLVSFGIVSILCLQLWMSFFAHRATITGRFPLLARLYPANLWPFLPYGMFQRPHYPGDKLDSHFLVGILDDSTEVPIRDADFPYWQFRVLLQSIAGGESERIAEFVQRWENQHQQRLQGLRLENRPLVFTGSTLEDGPREVLKNVVLPIAMEPHP